MPRLLSHSAFWRSCAMQVGGVQTECKICTEPCGILAVPSCNDEICAFCFLKLGYLSSLAESEDSKSSNTGAKTLTVCPFCKLTSQSVEFKSYPGHTSEIRIWSDMDPNSVSYRIKLQNKMRPIMRKYNIVCESSEIEMFVGETLSPICIPCRQMGNPVSLMKDVKQLAKHLEVEHKLFFCNICYEGRKDSCFLFENQLFQTAADRKEHISHGRSDANPPIPPHAICHICEKWFHRYDSCKEHCRSNHFICELCEKIHSSEPIKPSRITAFPDVDSLQTHFNNFHFNCHSEACLFIAFDSEIELAQHRKDRHGDKLTSFEYRPKALPKRSVRMPPKKADALREEKPHALRFSVKHLQTALKAIEIYYWKDKDGTDFNSKKDLQENLLDVLWEFIIDLPYTFRTTASVFELEDHNYSTSDLLEDLVSRSMVLGEDIKERCLFKSIAKFREAFTDVNFQMLMELESFCFFFFVVLAKKEIREKRIEDYKMIVEEYSGNTGRKSIMVPESNEWKIFGINIPFVYSLQQQLNLFLEHKNITASDPPEEIQTSIRDLSSEQTIATDNFVHHMLSLNLSQTKADSVTGLRAHYARAVDQAQSSSTPRKSFDTWKSVSNKVFGLMTPEEIALVAGIVNCYIFRYNNLKTSTSYPNLSTGQSAPAGPAIQSWAATLATKAPKVEDFPALPVPVPAPVEFRHKKTQQADPATAAATKIWSSTAAFPTLQSKEPPGDLVFTKREKKKKGGVASSPPNPMSAGCWKCECGYPKNDPEVKSCELCGMLRRKKF
eukprot:GHVP01062829.1.p1 GENE.GHVP01062829.1~~GHVP01062829.1.p1  ORF type:complete len:795 (-),score=127.81 GHVP01062829.1:667-3009(-)